MTGTQTTFSPPHPLYGVRERREAKDMTGDQIAHMLGVTRNTYYRYERGERIITLPRALSLSRILGCTVEDLAVPPPKYDPLGHLVSETNNEPADAPDASDPYPVTLD